VTVNYFLPVERYTSSMSLGKRIEGARLAKGYEESASFARACGISKQTMHNLENDLVKKPDPATLMKIAVALNVTLDWLWTGEGLPGRNQLIDSGEWEVVSLYRQLSYDVRKRVCEMLNELKG
jgi:transcriptional regulator with XRE-family HTH domain